MMAAVLVNKQWYIHINGHSFRNALVTYAETSTARSSWSLLVRRGLRGGRGLWWAWVWPVIVVWGTVVMVVCRM